jgi:hypothetical protein
VGFDDVTTPVLFLPALLSDPALCLRPDSKDPKMDFVPHIGAVVSVIVGAGRIPSSPISALAIVLPLGDQQRHQTW